MHSCLCTAGPSSIRLIVLGYTRIQKSPHAPSGATCQGGADSANSHTTRLRALLSRAKHASAQFKNKWHSSLPDAPGDVLPDDANLGFSCHHTKSSAPPPSCHAGSVQRHSDALAKTKLLPRLPTRHLCQRQAITMSGRLASPGTTWHSWADLRLQPRTMPPTRALSAWTLGSLVPPPPSQRHSLFGSARSGPARRNA